MRREQPLPLVAVAACGPLLAPLGVAQLYAVLVGEVLHGVGEAEPVVLHQEGDDVAALAATEAVEEVLATGLTLKDGRLLVVEGAEALLGAAAGVLSVT